MLTDFYGIEDQNVERGCQVQRDLVPGSRGLPLSVSAPRGCDWSQPRLAKPPAARVVGTVSFSHRTSASPPLQPRPLQT